MSSSLLLSPAKSARRLVLQLNQKQHLRASIRPLSSFSSMNDPSPTLFHKPTSTPSSTDKTALIRSDVRTMGSILGQLIKSNSPTIFSHVETLRTLTKEWNASVTIEDKSRVMSTINDILSSLSDEELRDVSKSFAHFLALANTAERHHRTRLLSMNKGGGGGEFVGGGALPTKHDSCGGVIPQLVGEMGVSPEEVYESLINQTVEIVFTAHPTEVNRPTIMNKHKRLYQHLASADHQRTDPSSTSYQKSLLDTALRTEISLLWQSDKVSRDKPTPVLEAERGTLVVQNILWNTLPSFLRRLDATLHESIGKTLPLTAAPIRFASWMGGDRDGNPNVTPNTTREVCLANRATAAKLFRLDLEEIHEALSLTTCTDEFRSLIGSEEQEREPYRAYLQPIISKLKLTESWASQSLSRLHDPHAPLTIPTDDIYLTQDALRNDLLPIYDSLVSTDNNAIIAEGALTDTFRRLSAFGLTLIPLDVRQESDRHAEALDGITRFLGAGRYGEWDEETRLIWLQKQISSRRPLLRRGTWNDHPEVFTPTMVDTLETFAMIADQHEGSLGTYVISQATSASDVLAVLLLQRDAGVKNPLKVAPLFETLSDLEGAGETMERLFTIPCYVGMIDGEQEVMIGYSDSAKDAGRLAASWAQYETQDELACIAKKHNINLTFFHGKGGTVGRGGNPATFKAILGKPPQTLNGRFRVTEQGEMIHQNFGHPIIAERTLDIFTAAVLAEAHTPRPRPTPEWKDLMQKLSDVSCQAYRDIVRGDDRFVPYFRSATPELELGKLNIGSRPAKRKVGGGVESLRAIPWIFAWMQNRMNLPSWLGVGEAIGTMLESEEDGEKLRRMYNEWDNFKNTTHLVEMVLAKSEPDISKNYEDNLVTDPHVKQLGDDIRKRHALAKKAILDLTGHSSLSEDNELLMRLLAVRNPYVYALNVIQAETLKRLREGEVNGDGETNEMLNDALLTTITGIANGMGNTG